ncbi:ATP-binding protein [Undibacterium sp. Di24W]|uniref:ATP-binding protein n=1 Tax=Undibacterium sp. Di24W TaxID=3413033 RepID=UPI003BF3C8EF
MDIDYRSAEVFAQANGLIQIFLAALLWRNRRLQNEPGLGWFAYAMAAAGVLNSFAPSLITPVVAGGPKPSIALLAQVILGVGCLAALFTGIWVYCTRLLIKPVWIFIQVFFGLPLVYGLLSSVGLPSGGEAVTFAMMAWCSVVTWKAEKFYPTTGHHQLAGVLAMYPIILIIAQSSGVSLNHTRYISSGPFTLIGLVLLFVALNRLRLLRETALEDLRLANLNLEEQVRKRTAELALKNEDLQISLKQVAAGEIQARQSQQRLQEILDASGEGIWEWQVQTGEMSNNRRWCEMMGISDVSTSRTIEIFNQLLPEKGRERIEQAINRSLHGLEHFQLEHQMVRTDGAVIWVLDKGDVVERDEAGKPVRMVGTVSDITSDKQAHEELVRTHEELRQTKDQMVQSEKMASLGALVAGVSHELNTPLGNAVTATSTLQDERRVFAKKMEKGITRSELNLFLQMVGESGDLIERNLLKANELIYSFKQVAIDQSTFNRRKFDLKELVNEIVLTMSPSFKRTPFVITTDVPVGISMDSFPGSLGQVLMNLLSNALVHGFDGLTNGHVFITAKIEHADFVSLSVRDDGRGIPKNIQQKIYDPFFTTRLGKGGSGLGLNIVFNVVTGLLGGTISLESELDEGAHFQINLPITAPDRNVSDENKED